MIKVTSSHDSQDFYINHKKIESIRQIGPNLHITLDSKNIYIVKNTILDIKTQIINFEYSIINNLSLENGE